MNWAQLSHEQKASYITAHDQSGDMHGEIFLLTGGGYCDGVTAVALTATSRADALRRTRCLNAGQLPRGIEIFGTTTVRWLRARRAGQ